jgi:crossover junction endodeoxyribonuclease RusA
MASLSISTGWPSQKLSPNGRPNRFEKARAIKAAKAEGYVATLIAKPLRGFRFEPGRLKVTIHAHPPTAWRTGDGDNLVASCKALLDGIAEALAVNDRCFEVQPVSWEERTAGGSITFEVSDQ